MKQVPETAMLARYRAELKDVRQQISTLIQKRDALKAMTAGLEALLRVHGIDPDHLEDEVATAPPDAEGEPRTFLTPFEGDAVMIAAIKVLEEAGKPMGAKDIERALMQKNLACQYYKLYRTLNGAAASTTGVIRKFRNGFGLREWTTNDTGADW